MERALGGPRSRPALPKLDGPDGLLARLAAGERSAFHPLFDALWPLLRRFTTRLLASESDGEDAAQQALLKLFARARQYDPERAALPFILAIAANEVRTLRKQRGRRKEVGSEPLAPLPAGQPSPEQAAIRRDLAAALSEIYTDLRPADLATLAQALSGEPAARPQVAGATFRKRVERALERLRLAWRAKHGVL